MWNSLQSTGKTHCQIQNSPAARVQEQNNRKLTKFGIISPKFSFTIVAMGAKEKGDKVEIHTNSLPISDSCLSK